MGRASFVFLGDYAEVFEVGREYQNSDMEQSMFLRLNELEVKVGKLESVQVGNHAENRKDIGILMRGQEDLVKNQDGLQQSQNKFFRELHDGLDRMAEKMSAAIEKAVTPIRQDVFALQMWQSRTTGYALGLAAVSALVFKLVAHGMAKLGF